MQNETVAPPYFPFTRERPLDPPDLLATFRAEMPVTKVAIWNGNEPWLVTRHEDVKAVLSNPAVSADNTHPAYPGPSQAMAMVRERYRSFVTMDAPDHSHYRRMLTAYFSVKSTRDMRPMIQTVVDQLVADMKAAERPLDLVDQFALKLPSITICHLLGVPNEDHEFFQVRAQVMGAHTSSPEEAAQATEELVEGYIGMLVDAKIEDPGSDILSQLARDHYATGELTRHDLLSLARLLLVAGHDTTGNTIALGTVVLMQNRDQWERLCADPSLMPGAVEEILRFVTVTQTGIRRFTREDIEVGGVTIPAGEGIIVNVASANRDERAFEAPNTVDIARANVRQHVGFGYGVHQCLGQNLARAELEIAFGGLTSSFPTLELAVPFEELEFMSHSHNYGVRSLPVTWS